MKKILFIIHLPIILLFTGVFHFAEQYRQGDRVFLGAFQDQEWVNSAFQKLLATFYGKFTDLKFQVRGPRPVQNKIVLVEIDDQTIANVGRWPWHRDASAKLIDQIFSYGPKVVGLDLIFSEEDRRLPDELRMVLRGADVAYTKWETDNDLISTVQKHKDRLVLGMTPDNFGKPANLDVLKEMAPSTPFFENFSLGSFDLSTHYNQGTNHLIWMAGVLENHPIFAASAKHAGLIWPYIDSDGVIRRVPLVGLFKDKAYPTLGLAVASVATGDQPKLSWRAPGQIAGIEFPQSGRFIPTNGDGSLEVNFYGYWVDEKRRDLQPTFERVSALEVLKPEMMGELTGRKLASEEVKGILSKKFKDALVVVGITALGVYDLRTFPFEAQVPGVLGHVTVLDNLLSAQTLLTPSSAQQQVWLYVFMTAVAFLFAFAVSKMEAIPSLLTFLALFFGFGFFDQHYLFERNINWTTGYFYVEIGLLFVMTYAARYMMEEQNKKFIKSAFTKYVSPAVVDSILKDPKKLSLGGEKKDLTILFSDIRGFTTFSEKMDPKSLAAFLNDYLGIMTDIVFKNQGTLDKYIGDAVMAFWGAPIHQEDHAARAVVAAVEMLKALRANYERFQKQYGIDVHVGVGMNSGSVNVGNMGSSTIFEYTVIGDHVNLASRLEGLTKTYGVTILSTRHTLDWVEKSGARAPQHRTLDFVKVKGKKTAVELIQLMDEEVPTDLLEQFQKAREWYTQRKWDEARDKFLLVNSRFKELTGQEDGPSQMFVERCEKLKLNPPSSDWDGSWEMTSK